MPRPSKKLAKISNVEPEMTDKCGKALNVLDAYQNSFTQVADLEVKIGLSETRGLRKDFINAARNLEAQFKDLQETDILIALLQLRRQEKKLHDPAEPDLSGTGHTVNRDKLLNLLENSNEPQERKEKLVKVLAAYSRAFEEYVDSKGKEAKELEILVQNARNVEPVVEKIRFDAMNQYMSVLEIVEYGMLGIELLCAALIVLTALWISASITRPLSALQKYAHQVAEGDLEATTTGTFVAEFKSLRKDITRMVAKLKEKLDEVRIKEMEALNQAEKARTAMAQAQKQEAKVKKVWNRLVESARQVEEVSTQVAVESAQLSAMVAQVKTGSLVQNDRMVETATAMEQMSASIIEVAKNAGNAASSALEAKEMASAGATKVKNAVDAIAEVNEHTSQMQEGIQNLSKKVDSIEKVMDVITEIADQTNLLALNAAIEAARAGDAGRGFAVVADEVRKLAEKTMIATKEVEENIKSIQDATHQNIDTMNKALLAVEKSTGLARESGQAQEEIVSLVEDSCLQAESIASASEEQSAAGEQINRAVEEVSRIAGESVQGMMTSHDAVERLASLARQLKEMVEKMVVDSDGDEESKAYEAPDLEPANTRAMPS